MTLDQARRALALLERARWPEGAQAEWAACEDLSTGDWSVTVDLSAGQASLGRFRLLKPVTRGAIQNLIAQAQACVDADDERADRTADRPTWLRVSLARVCALPASCGRARFVALQVLADLEAEDIPPPRVRLALGRVVVLSWADHGSVLNIFCHASGLVQVGPWSPGKDWRPADCRTVSEVTRRARAALDLVADWGATREEMEELCTVRRAGRRTA